MLPEICDKQNNINYNKTIRLIARLDVKGERLIKGVHLEGLRAIGTPEVFAEKYYEEGADEILYMDIVASLYGRTNLLEIVRRTAKHTFIPLTVGGGVREVVDVDRILRAGADKVAINTAAVNRPDLISEVSRKYGSQCTVLSIEAKKTNQNSWEVLTNCGRESTGMDVLNWAKAGAALGAGEILLTSIDREGTRTGFDNDLVAAVSGVVKVPLIASGGYGRPQDLKDVIDCGADAVAIADALHYQRTSIQSLRDYAISQNIRTRLL